MKLSKVAVFFLTLSVIIFISCNNNENIDENEKTETTEELIRENLGETLPFEEMNDTMQIKHLVKVWNSTHNPRYLDKLEELYDHTLFFYGEERSRGEAISVKRKLFAKYPTYLQKIIGQLDIKRENSNEYKVEFTKFITVKQTTLPIPSYIVFKKISPNNWLIIAESDVATDEKKIAMRDSLLLVGDMYSPSMDLIKGNFYGSGIDTLFIFQDEDALCLKCKSSLYFTNEKLPPLEIKSTSPIIVFNEKDLDGDGLEEFTVLKNTEEDRKSVV